MRIGKYYLGHSPLIFLLLSIQIALILGLPACGAEERAEDYGKFNGARAYQDVVSQVEIGARHPGTAGHEQILDYLTEELTSAGWQVERHKAEIHGQGIINLIASRDADANYVLLGAHYDSRIYADRDPDQALRNDPVPAANDGASGVAVLLELARTLPEDLPVPIRLVFFDAEDNGGIEGWDWILGSRAYVRDIDPLPEQVVILDMIGDADLQVYYESNSDPRIRDEIWSAADDLGYGQIFIKEVRHAVLDDHTPFLEAGIPAVDVIDLNYPYWHTTQDTADKVSPDSLQTIGETITSWLGRLD